MDANENRIKSPNGLRAAKVQPLEIDESFPIKKALTSNAADAKDNWSGKLDFFLSALSFSVGLGAIWRFPYLCYKNGGGAFLIPFLIFLLILGIPLMYMEFSIGQFTSRGPVSAWNMMPFTKGVGVTMCLIDNYLNMYYVLIIGYSLYYLVLSIRAVLPWEKCNPKWASPNCVDDFSPSVFNYTVCNTTDYEYFKCKDGRCYVNTTISTGIKVDCDTNRTLLQSTGYWNPIFPSQDYWNKVVLRKSSGIDETGGLVWQLVIALFVAWAVCFLTLFRGIKLSGKIVYFTALFPYVVLLILGIRGVMLDGADIGILYYIKPDIKRLSEIEVWKDAAVQVFFSLSLSYGGLTALSSYNKFNHNILRDAFMLSISNFLTCLLAGFVVFTYMGVLAKTTNMDIQNVVQSGQGLVYIVYPFAATTISVSPLWAVMFFVMMIALGMGTIMASVGTLVTSLEDIFPVLKRTALIKAATLGAMCVAYFLIGLLFCTQAGSYWIEIFDFYSANHGILICGIFQCVTIGWIYGMKRFRFDVSSMIPIESSTRLLLSNTAIYLWTACWKVITPVLLTAILIYSLVDNDPLKLGDYTFPMWSHILGNFMSFSVLLGIVGRNLYDIYLIFRYRKPFFSLFKKDAEYRPLFDENNQIVTELYQELSTFNKDSVFTLLRRKFSSKQANRLDS